MMKGWLGVKRIERGNPQGRAKLFPALLLSLLPFLGSSSMGLAETPTLDRGEDLYRACRSCHEIGENAKNKVGPHLDGIEGRIAGSIGEFSYSDAMRQAGDDGLAWDADSLHQYLEKPRLFIPGNRMSFRGMKEEADRAALIAYLFEAGRAEPDPSGPDTAALDGPANEMADLIIGIDGDPEYGEYLSGECVTCHQISGHADGIPSIVGLPQDYFIRSLLEYKHNIRNNEVMKLMVSNMGNDEMAALAAYFGAQTPE